MGAGSFHNDFEGCWWHFGRGHFGNFQRQLRPFERAVNSSNSEVIARSELRVATTPQGILWRPKMAWLAGSGVTTWPGQWPQKNGRQMLLHGFPLEHSGLSHLYAMGSRGLSHIEQDRLSTLSQCAYRGPLRAGLTSFWSFHSFIAPPQ